MSGMEQVQARIAQIQTRIDALVPRSVRPAPSASGGVSGSTDSFAAALKTAQDQGAEQAGTSLLATLGAAALPSGLSALAGAGPVKSAGTPSQHSEGALVAAAKKYLGVPYKWGGTDPAVGLDCSGFTQRAFKDIGIDLSRVTQTQVKEGRAVSSLAKARPGDLLFFENNIQPGLDHVGIYLGGGKMIAAPKAGDVVKIQNVYKTPAEIRRILPGEPAALTATTSASSPTQRTSGTGSIPWSKYHDMFVTSGTKHGVPPRLLGAFATVENASGNPNAVSPAGAIGVMQFMPGTARGLGIDPRDPAQAIDGAARHLSRLIKKYGSIDLAAAAYNAGEGNVAKYGGIPPFKETQEYVVKINKALEGLR